MKCSKNLVRLIVTFALSFGLLVAVPAVAQAADTGLTADSAAGLKAGATADSNAAGALQTQAVKKYNVWIGGKAGYFEERQERARKRHRVLQRQD